ncbi:MAG: hypothetical protein CMM93_06515 [Rickettsiales bacterium]|mgnify:CR=1 FL=1|nr:hypothetical protein [Rickettsiales bacterium]|tara:strand:- start:2209 stop:2553 length:345 start_codon:yes stop_codon:yes gene_type:complete
MPQTISAKQCRKARSLLKWNIPDLSNKTGLQPDRLDKFERNLIRLMGPEFKDLIKALEDNGIEFKADFEVNLKKAKSSGGGGTSKTYIVDQTLRSQILDDQGRLSEERDEDSEN